MQSLEVKRRTNPAPPGWTSKASSPSIEDSHPIQTLLTSTDIGSLVTIDSTMQLAGMTACLWTPEPLEIASEMPHGTMSIGVVVTPGISTMSMSCIIRDEATGVTYMDMVTTSIGRVALSGLDLEAS